MLLLTGLRAQLLECSQDPAGGVLDDLCVAGHLNAVAADEELVVSAAVHGMILVEFDTVVLGDPRIWMSSSRRFIA